MHRKAFTLVELLVATAILLILVAMTVTTVNFALDAERVGSSARQVQSMLAGARDRAIYERVPVGVRFIPSESDPSLCTAAIYVEQQYWSDGSVSLTQTGTWANNDSVELWTATGSGTNWLLIQDRITDGESRLWVSGEWYTIVDFDGSAETATILVNPSKGTPPPNPAEYKIRIPPVVRPNQEPTLLSRGVAIDTSRSQLPAAWTPDSREILFSPDGTVVGPAATRRMIHFYLRDIADIEAGLDPSDGEHGDQAAVTVFTTTGAIRSVPVDPTDSDGDGVADSLFHLETD